MVEQPQNQFDVNSWEECERKIAEIEGSFGHGLDQILFRGQADSDWTLATTLERRKRGFCSLMDYYLLVQRIRPAVETFSGLDWDFPTSEDLATRTANNDPDIIDDLPAFSYLANLRHHGFPSPLLDWTGSQYVAAYFAFSLPTGKERVAIYIYSEMPSGRKASRIDDSVISLFGPYVKTHRRHFIQQSSYTVCVHFDAGWKFVPHQTVFERAHPGQDLLWKITIPATERGKVLRALDRMNINAFSLFDNQEGLMEMLAVREIDLDPRYS